MLWKSAVNSNAVNFLRNINPLHKSLEFKFPEKYKNTFVEKWEYVYAESSGLMFSSQSVAQLLRDGVTRAGDGKVNPPCVRFLGHASTEMKRILQANYWKNLCIDYKEVAIDTAKASKEKPVKAIFYLSGLGFLSYCAHKNPDEKMFRDRFLGYANDLSLVGEPVRNLNAVRHLEFIEQCYNEGVIRILNLGVVSFVWLNDFDSSSGLFQAQCEYLEPKLLTFHKRVIDVGFLGRWWLLERTMKDYDVNTQEFKE